MRRKLIYMVVVCCLMAATVPCVGAGIVERVPINGVEVIERVPVDEPENDTLYHAVLHEVYCFAPIKFKNRQQERFYWRTVRDVKKTLPYAKRINQAIIEAEDTLAQLTPKERRRWWNRRERELFREYEKDFRGMTASQGRMLMLLLDRESNRTSYELIRTFKSKFVADFWQFIAKLFKNDLKEEYDAKDKDRIIERIIILVENDQL